MLRAVQARQTEAVWDLMHYGWPDELDIWSPGFVNRFAEFAALPLGRPRRNGWHPVLLSRQRDIVPRLGRRRGGLSEPYTRGRGFELKVQLARAAIAAMHEILAVDPRARFVHCEPAINIAAQKSRPDQRRG